MRVRILTSRDGHPCGAEVDMDDARAEDLIGAGDAEAIASAAPSLETATDDRAPETTVQDRPAKRNK
jgi:hypothetical protein